MRAVVHAVRYLDLSVKQSGNDSVAVIPDGTASGMPVIVNPQAGRRAGINPAGAITFLAPDIDVFAQPVIAPNHSRELRPNVRFAGRGFPGSHDWRHVFDDVYRTYETGRGVTGQPNVPVAELGIEQ